MQPKRQRDIRTAGVVELFVWFEVSKAGAGEYSGLLVLYAFTRLRKSIISFVMSVCSSIHSEQLVSHWMHFNKIWYLNIFRESVEKIQVSLQSDKNIRYFTWSPMYIYGRTSLSSS